MIDEHLEYLKEELKSCQKTFDEEKEKGKEYNDLLVDGLEKIALGFEKIAKFTKINSPFIRGMKYEKNKIDDIQKQITEIETGLEFLKKNN